jgi:hypothetical protein
VQSRLSPATANVITGRHNNGDDSCDTLIADIDTDIRGPARAYLKPPHERLQDD